MVNSGVYTITNIISDKIYIGSTIDFDRRWDGHKDSLHKGIHHNKHLQRSWNKYGEEVFEFGVLEYLDNLEELHLAEQFWMDVYREESRELYNIALTTDCPNRGRSPTKETRRKLSEARKGMKFSKEHKHKLSEAAKRTQPFLGHKHSDETKQRISKSRGRPYPAFVHQETGEVIPAGVNLSELCRGRGIHYEGMWRIVHRKQSHYGGWELLGDSLCLETGSPT